MADHVQDFELAAAQPARAGAGEIGEQVAGGFGVDVGLAGRDAADGLDEVVGGFVAAEVAERADREQVADRPVGGELLYRAGVSGCPRGAIAG